MKTIFVSSCFCGILCFQLSHAGQGFFLRSDFEQESATNTRTGLKLTEGRKQLYAPYVKPGSIKVDGKMKEKAWASAFKTEQFGDLKRANQLGQQSKRTELRLLCDGQNLIIGMKNRVQSGRQLSENGQLTSGQDVASIWTNESVEVFLKGNFEKYYYFNFTFNCFGARVEFGREGKEKRAPYNYNWNPSWDLKTSRNEKEQLWTAEFKIPLRELGHRAGAEPLDTRFNIGRNLVMIGAGYLSLEESGYHKPENFSYLRCFRTPPSTDFISMTDAYYEPGAGGVVCRIQNAGQKKSIGLALKVTGAETSRQFEKKSLRVL